MHVFYAANCIIVLGQLTYGSWSFHGLDLNFTARDESADLSSYKESGEWETLGDYHLYPVQVLMDEFLFPGGVCQFVNLQLYDLL